MSKTERLVGLIGAILAILAFLDTYVLKSQLASALRLPNEVPTGLLVTVLFVLCAVVLVLTARISRLAASFTGMRSERDDLRRELEQVRADGARVEMECEAARVRVSELKEELSKIKAANDDRSLLVQGFRSQIIGLLSARSRSAAELMADLGISKDEPLRKAFREKIGELVSEGIVRRRAYSLEDYELSSDWLKSGSAAKE